MDNIHVFQNVMAFRPYSFVEVCACVSMRTYFFMHEKAHKRSQKKPRNPGDIHCIGCMQHLHMRMYTSIVQIADYQEIKVTWISAMLRILHSKPDQLKADLSLTT